MNNGEKCYGCSCAVNEIDNTEYCGKLIKKNGVLVKSVCDITCPQCKSCNYKIKKKYKQQPTFYPDKCANCSCVLQYGKDKEFCGKLGRIKGKITTLGCDKRCPQCTKCDYDSSDNSPTTRNYKGGIKSINSYLNNKHGTEKNDGILSRKEFLNELKKQQIMNTKQMKYTTRIANNKKDSSNNKNKGFNNIANNINNITHGYDELDEKELQECVSYDEKNCLIENGCGWNKLSDLCQDLEVIAYTDMKRKGEDFKLQIGNYDLPDIDNFNFIPKYISIPKGVRVKIYHKSGFVGQYDLYIGNYIYGSLEDSHLQEINKIGSIQICDMITCSKPNNLGSLKLINMISNNNIDFINEENVENIEEYKKMIKNNIKNRIQYILNTQTECLDNIIEFLKRNNINLDKNFDEESDINTLHKIKYLLYNLPKCKELLKYENLSEKIYQEKLKKDCPKFNTNNNNTNNNNTNNNNTNNNNTNNNNNNNKNNTKILNNYLGPSYNTNDNKKKNNNINKTIFNLKEKDYHILLVIIIIILILVIIFILYNYNNNTPSVILKDSIKNNINRINIR